MAATMYLQGTPRLFSIPCHMNTLSLFGFATLACHAMVINVYGTFGQVRPYRKHIIRRPMLVSVYGPFQIRMMSGKNVVRFRFSYFFAQSSGIEKDIQ